MISYLHKLYKSIGEDNKMDHAQLLLLAELPGLEVARQVIEARIDEIRNRLSVDGEYVKPPAILDSTILGRDVLGRINRKRAEVLEKKRKLLAAARAIRAEKLAQAKIATLGPVPRTKSKTR
jgi:hypothetical protein